MYTKPRVRIIKDTLLDQLCHAISKNRKQEKYFFKVNLFYYLNLEDDCQALRQLVSYLANG